MRFAAAILDLLEANGVKKFHLERLFRDTDFRSRVITVLTEPEHAWYTKIGLAEVNARLQERDNFLSWVWPEAADTDIPTERARYQDWALLNELLGRLSASERAMVILRFGLDIHAPESEAELAERFGVQVRTIRKNLSAIPRKLQRRHASLVAEAIREEEERDYQAAPDKITSEMLPERPYNCLARARIRTLSDLTQRTPDDLLAITNLGQRSLTEIEAMLDERGMSLKGA